MTKCECKCTLLFNESIQAQHWLWCGIVWYGVVCYGENLDRTAREWRTGAKHFSLLQAGSIASGRSHGLDSTCILLGFIPGHSQL